MSDTEVIETPDATDFGVTEQMPDALAAVLGQAANETEEPKQEEVPKRVVEIGTLIAPVLNGFLNLYSGVEDIFEVTDNHTAFLLLEEYGDLVEELNAQIEEFRNSRE